MRCPEFYVNLDMRECLLSIFLSCAANFGQRTGPASDAGLTTALHYLTISSNRRISAIDITSDSLILRKDVRRPGFEVTRYKILETTQKDKYKLYYLKRATVPYSEYQKDIGLAFVRLSPGKQRLYFLLEDRRWYSSVEACKAANAPDSLSDKYFFTYYAETDFQRFLTYPDVHQADTATMRQVKDDFFRMAYSSKEKIRRTQQMDPYGGGHVQDMLDQVLIDHHLSPAATVGDLSPRRR